MVAFVQYNDFSEQIGLAAHNLNTDTLRVALSNTAQLVTWTQFSQVGEIAAGNGYTAGGEDTQNTWSENPAGTGEMVCTDVIWTASGGAINTFQYVILYNDTHASDLLIGYWDYGSAVDLADGETFTVDFGANTLTVS